MSNPPLFVHPDHVDPTISGDGQGLRPPLPPGTDPNQANDWGSVHINSGIPNKAAFLIAQGGVHNGIMTFGIGRPKTGRLYYDVLTTRLAKNAQLLEARNVTVEQARDYVRGGPWPPGDVRNDFTTTDVCDVINAFAAVGLGPPDTDCDGEDNFEDTDDDGDGILDNDDKDATLPTRAKKIPMATPSATLAIPTPTMMVYAMSVGRFQMIRRERRLEGVDLVAGAAITVALLRTRTNSTTTLTVWATCATMTMATE
jgi:hypothetical protein